ncbi:hypothetical protein LTR28_011812, partial [Elasticomyces elasticus]
TCALLPALLSHLKRFTCPSPTAAQASIMRCGWNAVALMAGSCFVDSGLVCRRDV